MIGAGGPCRTAGEQPVTASNNPEIIRIRV
jgi:hypothetical protein